MTETIELIVPSKYQLLSKVKCYSQLQTTACHDKVFVLVLISSPFYLVMPKFPKENTEPIVVEEGEPFVLQCNPPEGVPPRKIHWMSIGKLTIVSVIYTEQPQQDDLLHNPMMIYIKYSVFTKVSIVQF